ncbi:hypothetical protein Acr_07g0012030 [Actinidia rufa]|uniref:Uncharacterized protein n=1 Tax=Actinidia rufa TaxID=165716 RepID=A0A7J0EZE6_9ERIC|nr:hypothetical protein Acr_07g0012030 [Actinidia rufa]
MGLCTSSFRVGDVYVRDVIRDREEAFHVCWLAYLKEIGTTFDHPSWSAARHPVDNDTEPLGNGNVQVDIAKKKVDKKADKEAVNSLKNFPEE